MGIGMPWPAEKLEVGGNLKVNGNIRASGGFLFPDNSMQKTAVVIRMGMVSAANTSNLSGYSVLDPEHKKDRVYEEHVSFGAAFLSPPNVFLALSYLDSEHATNTRINIHALNITKNEFTLRIVTWSDTLIYGVVARWLAVGN